MKAVILAGGKGTRLRPYTTVLPKPLMPVGDLPILEILIRQLRVRGLRDIIISTGYLGRLIMAFFEDGSNLGVNIEYSKEEQPLGTVGGLALMKHYLTDTFLMINGDTLTSLDFSDLIAYHKKHSPIATVALNRRKVYVDFGVVEIGDNSSIVGYIEKPTIEHLVSMGVYVLEPEILKYIEPGAKMDFPDLVKLLISCGEDIRGYTFEGYWLDIGRVDDYERANAEIDKMRKELRF